MLKELKQKKCSNCKYNFKTEVGEWIINQNRLVIGQIIGINEERQEATIKVNRLELLIGFWNIRKHSKSIIDLIEVGDIVNEHYVRATYLEGITRYIKLGNSCGTRTYEKDIKSILTHEQYEQNCYTVEKE